MDFSQIGVKSRKTGLKAKENVRRDEHDMEDVDDFFREDQTLHQSTSTSAQNNNQHQQQYQPTSNDNNTDRPNGRIIFPPSNDQLRSPTIPNLRNSPLLSPLPAHSQKKNPSPLGAADNENTNNKNNESDDSDQFDDANENPPIHDGNSNNEDDDMEMDIDDESRGDIKMVDNSFNHNNDDNDDRSGDFDFSFNEDTQKVYRSSPNHSDTPKQRSQRLFVPSDEEKESNSSKTKSYSQRQNELERNTTVRSSVKNSRSTAPASRTQSPTKLKPTSSLKPSLQPSLQPSSKSIASFSKKLALNKIHKNPRSKSRPRTPDQDDHDSSDYNDSGKEIESEVDEDISGDSSRYNQEEEMSSDLEPEPTLPTLADDDDDSDEEVEDDSDEQIITASLRKKRLRDGRRGGDSDDHQVRSGGRVNKFQRSAPGSPSKQHIIDVSSLRREQEYERSRSASRGPVEQQPTRRSSRVRIPPLAFWRNERAVYEKSRGDKVPTLKKIITVDEITEPIRVRTRNPSRLNSRAPSRAPSRTRDNGSETPSRQLLNPQRSHQRPKIQPAIVEDDEDDEEEPEDENITNAKGSEWLREGYLNLETFEGHGSDVKHNRLIAWGPGTETYTSQVKSATDNFKLAILFDKNRDFIATGMMLIPPGGVKSLKGTDTTYFVFYCISGIIEVTLSGNVFLIKKGCSLEIPMGNFYQFANKGKKDATLFFVQTRGQVDEDEEGWDD